MTAADSTKILFLGSNVKITNLPMKEVSLLEEGSLPAYGYNPGDNIVLLAGPATIEKGRLEQCLAWLSAYLNGSDLSPKINSLSYGSEKQVYQMFRKRRSGRDSRQEGWFMVKQLLPAEERGDEAAPFSLSAYEYELAGGNNGMVLIDDSGMPPHICDEMSELNPGMWCIALGISVAHWQHWACLLGDRFTLFCRLSDLETTRMEMDSSVNWETIVAMCLRALRTPEVGLWDNERHRFLCRVIIEMYPHAILYVGPDAVYFRYRKGSLPEKSSSRKRGSVPCYDTMVTAMLAMRALRFGGLDFSKKSFSDFSKQVLCNWKKLDGHGYHFDENGLRLPTLDCSSACLSGLPCSCADKDAQDPAFIELPYFTPEFEESLELAAGQVWGEKKKKALRSFFRHQYTVLYPAAEEGLVPQFCYIDVIMSVLHCLKEEVNRGTGFDSLSIFKLGHLRTTDPAEIDPVITLHQVMDSYVSKETVLRPLCIGVFGPPGSGKSFAVKQVAGEIARHYDNSPFVFFEFNLTQFASPDEINAAIDPIRASVAQGKVPIAFWDEFDCRYDGHEFGYLRYFLPAMQDGVTYVQGIPYHIGRAIFVFAGGVKASWEGMERLLTPKKPKDLQLAKTLKIPDFMSRLRVVLDIDGIEVPEYLLKDSASQEELEELRRILLKRAFIIAHQMQTHWKSAARKTSGLLLRLLLADYKFGARSIEAVIEASRAADRLVYGLPELIAPSAARIHADWRVDLERKIDQFRKSKGLRAVW
ncbi:AAA family ATPase [Candidatus Electronema sp. JM]|uniref:AAA family ATPase n=1 Tax=Candidatus Electronema sp. JM TaxID=3401571 RepID=UPI003AA7C97F